MDTITHAVLYVAIKPLPVPLNDDADDICILCHAESKGFYEICASVSLLYRESETYVFEGVRGFVRARHVNVVQPRLDSDDLLQSSTANSELRQPGNRMSQKFRKQAVPPEGPLAFVTGPFECRAMRFKEGSLGAIV